MMAKWNIDRFVREQIMIQFNSYDEFASFKNEFGKAGHLVDEISYREDNYYVYCNNPKDNYGQDVIGRTADRQYLEKRGWELINLYELIIVKIELSNSELDDFLNN